MALGEPLPKQVFGHPWLLVGGDKISKSKGNAIYADDLGQNYDDLIFNLTPENPIYFWILEDKKTKLPFIAKIENKSTPLGKLKVYTQNIHIKE